MSPSCSRPPPPAPSTRPRHLYLDLSGLTFCDQTGLRALRQLTHQVHTAHISLRLTGLHPHACTAPSPSSTHPRPPAPRPSCAPDRITSRPGPGGRKQHGIPDASPGAAAGRGRDAATHPPEPVRGPAQRAHAPDLSRSSLVSLGP
ncbi:STAS domain-containing protein [Streptomyces sp. NPDC007355]|uniref:STAS domain-containing protein n=1 Tax=Streptomyces sp. NPDC007355 TaxID=3364778 RepID=UPI0036C91E9E